VCTTTPRSPRQCSADTPVFIADYIADPCERSESRRRHSAQDSAGFAVYFDV
jgi:hypothetical protein